MARILFLGQLFEGSTAVGRLHALESLGHELRSLEAFGPESGLTRLSRLARRRFGVGPAHPVNSALVEAAAAWDPDVVWIEKGIHVTAGALRAVRSCRPNATLIHYTCDRTAVRGNASCDMRAAFPLYDLAATTVAAELDYLRHLGARRVIRTWHGYAPELFRPVDPALLDASLAERVVFVGSWEAERARTLKSLVLAGLPVTIVSPWKQWEEVARCRGNVEWRRSLVFGDGYPALLASGGAALGFLRKMSGDLHTQRTFEIPASGGLLVAERTAEHLELFLEGSEAEFFGSDDECISKCLAVLADPARRREMVRAGHKRCTVSGYSWASRVEAVLAAASA